MATLYKLEFLSCFEHDLKETLTYFYPVLENPAAAESFLNLCQSAIEKRAKNPLVFEAYKGKKEKTLPNF
jgi:hypothetical protein